MRGLGDHVSIGERIAFCRKRRGYTQEVLAGLAGRSIDWLARKSGEPVYTGTLASTSDVPERFEALQLVVHG